MTEDIKNKHKYLLKQQKELRIIMERFEDHEGSMALFYQQHAQCHRSNASEAGSWTFADAVLDGLSQDQLRRIPGRSDHSIAWCLWHITRIEDATMNLLVDGGDQVFNRGEWGKLLEVDIVNTGNGMEAADIIRLSEAINTEALLSYCDAVGRQTRQIAARLELEKLSEKVHPERIEQLLEEGVLMEQGWGLADYWGNRTIAGLLLMPATRHNLSHLNECLKLRKARG